MIADTPVAELRDLALSLVALAALAFVYAVLLRLPSPPGWRRWVVRTVVGVAGAGLMLLVNLAIYRHDIHVDLTRDQAFSPAPETVRVVRGLTQDVELTYFYQKQQPSARAMRTMVEMMGRLNPRLHVRTVDPDQNPALANQLGARIYNAAVLTANGRRVEVVTTDDREIAAGIVRLLRTESRTVCFVTGHGEYDIDNFEYLAEFEGSYARTRTSDSSFVVQMEKHGLGRLRRALEKIGVAMRKVSLMSDTLSADCNVLVEASPRTAYAPPDSAALLAYLRKGGALLLFLEPDYPIDPSLAEVLAAAGVRFEPGILVDPASHYYTDEQMIAVAGYGKHPITAQLSMSFFPGARPLTLVPSPTVEAMALVSSSTSSYVATNRERAAEQAATASKAPRALAVASEGRLAEGAAPFRLVAFGDADFASNTFFPYLSNADLVLASLSWLMREAAGSPMTPMVEVLPTVTLNNQQTQAIFLVTVFVVPGFIALLGFIVWWMRRS